MMNENVSSDLASFLEHEKFCDADSDASANISSIQNSILAEEEPPSYFLTDLESFDNASEFDWTLSESEKSNGNDTLERVEFMMQMGKKIAEENKIRLDVLQENIIIPTNPNLPSTSNAMPKIQETQAKPKAAALQTPITDYRMINKRQYAHVDNPVSRYIHKTPLVPLIKRVKLQEREGAISDLYKTRDSEASFAVDNTDELEKSYVPSLPIVNVNPPKKIQSKVPIRKNNQKQ